MPNKSYQNQPESEQEIKPLITAHSGALPVLQSYTGRCICAGMRSCRIGAIPAYSRGHLRPGRTSRQGREKSRAHVAGATLRVAGLLIPDLIKQGLLRLRTITWALDIG